jgi:hypothetical protein
MKTKLTLLDEQRKILLITNDEKDKLMVIKHERFNQEQARDIEMLKEQMHEMRIVMANQTINHFNGTFTNFTGGVGHSGSVVAPQTVITQLESEQQQAQIVQLTSD